nr:HDOD domain-containing protein [Desulfobulbaceae bacterium]
MSEKLNEWIQKITDCDFPVFKSTVSSISKVTSTDDASASELASIILRDPSLTAKILKFSNSSYYNLSHSQTSTISRAVVLMGFEVVRDLSLSVAVIESILSSQNQQVVTELMAKSFHAASQARSIAAEKGEANLEEVFIATLMHNIGEMAFWCTAEENDVKEMQKALSECGSAKEAQKKVLGFTLTELSRALVEQWGLSPQLSEAFRKDDKTSSLMQSMALGEEIAETVPSGWDTDAATKVYRKVAAQLNLSSRESKTLVKEAAQKAAKVATLYGIPTIAKLIPGFESTIESPDDKPGEIVKFPDPDPLVQLKVLRELSGLIKTNPDLNLILEILLEGIHRGIGMDRAIFALYVPLRSQIRAKYAVGVNAEELHNSFSVNVGDMTSNPFSEALFDGAASMWLNYSSWQRYSVHIGKSIFDMLGTKEFFISPVIINGRPIGLFYADRLPSKRALDKTSFESFDHFAHQASFSIELISNRMASHKTA